jgi:predicted regulator of Ras-like GTPase activity (Roadblock/LC7/MglB family)
MRIIMLNGAIMVFNSPDKQAIKAIKKIGEGRGNKKLVDSLIKNINAHPELIRGTASGLLKIIKARKIETYGFCVDVLLNIARTKPEVLIRSSETIILLIRMSADSHDANTTLKAMDILNILISHRNELMQPVVPVLLKRLNDRDNHIRLLAYQMLDDIVTVHPEFFSEYTVDLIRSMHSVNDDEQIYAAKLLRKVASTSSSLISHDIDMDIESKDGDFAAVADELAEMMKNIDLEAYASEMLESIGMGNLIVNKNDDTVNNSLPDALVDILQASLIDYSNEEWINYIILTEKDGRVIASSNPDSTNKSIIMKICDIFNLNQSPSEEQEFSNRITLELSNKFIVAVSINNDYILAVFSNPDQQIVKVQNELNAIEKKIKDVMITS